MASKSSTIKDVKDLEGKTIGINALRGVAEVMIKNSLEKQGVDPDSIKLLEIPFPDIPAALGQKHVDAVLATAERPVLLAGRGTVHAGREAVLALAERLGAADAIVADARDGVLALLDALPSGARTGLRTDALR
jgi:ABC-type taurine transport system substrate-binding protein